MSEGTLRRNQTNLWIFDFYFLLSSVLKIIILANRQAIKEINQLKVENRFDNICIYIYILVK